MHPAGVDAAGGAANAPSCAHAGELDTVGLETAGTRPSAFPALRKGLTCTRLALRSAMTSLCVSARPCVSRAPARLACARAPVARSAAALRPPPPLAAGRRARAASRRSALHAVAQWVLIPIGTGDSTHLDAPATLPPTILLGADKLVVGRELSSTVNLALPVPTGASRPPGRRAQSAARASSATVAFDIARCRLCAPRLTPRASRPLRRASSVGHARHDRRGCWGLLRDGPGVDQRDVR